MGNGTWKIDGADFRAAGLAFLAVCIPLAIWFALNSPGVGSDLNAPIYVIALWSGIFYFYTLFLSGLIAFPLFVVLNRFRLLSAPMAVVSGAATWIGSILLLAPSQVSESTFYYALIGALLGGVFWPIYRFLRRKKHEF
jgi:membrane-anchored protein YejM (alkaline phosphatase superfamily)